MRKYPEWWGKEYEDVPRGRVVLRVKPSDNKFIVYMPRELRRHEPRVLAMLRIPSAFAGFDYSDLHYKYSSAKGIGD